MSADKVTKLQGQIFKPLPERVSTVDGFDDQTHTSTADAMYAFINSSGGEGLTIGLEGAWGTGKSQVIYLLDSKFKEESKTLFYIFDAWAHEGNPLRLAFLSGLIGSARKSLIGRKDDKAQDVYEILEEQGKKLTGSVTTTNTSVKPSLLGWLVTFTLVCTPIIAALLASVSVSKLTLGVSPYHAINWNATIAFGLIVAITLGFIVSFVRRFRFNKTSEKAKKTNLNGQLFESNETERNETVTLESGEPTSWEFEAHFSDLVEILFTERQLGFNKVIIVIDNLDRLSPLHTKHVWSTLQTFFQHRSSASDSDSNLQHVHFVIPFDRKNFCRAMDCYDSEKSSETLDERFDVLDKNFQVVFEVSPVISSGWVKYFESCVQRAFGKTWPADEITDFVATFKLLHSNLVTSPSPRKMRSVINRAGALVMQSKLELTGRVVCLYVCLRRKLDVTQLRSELILGDKSNDLGEFGVSNEERQQLAAILFNVEEEKALQLLLGEPIINALIAEDGNQLSELINSHQHGFDVAWKAIESEVIQLLQSEGEDFYSVSNSLVGIFSEHKKGSRGLELKLIEFWRKQLNPNEPRPLPNRERSTKALCRLLNWLSTTELTHYIQILSSDFSMYILNKAEAYPKTHEYEEFIKLADEVIDEFRQFIDWVSPVAQGILPEAWIEHRTRERQIVDEDGPKLMRYPADKVDDLWDKLGAFKSADIENFWLVEELFYLNPKDDNWNFYLSQFCNWITAIPQQPVSKHCRLAHKILTSDREGDATYIEALAKLNIKQNRLFSLNENDAFDAFFVSRYIYNSQRTRMPSQLVNIWNSKSTESDVLDAAVEVFDKDLKALWELAVNEKLPLAIAVVDSKPLSVLYDSREQAQKFGTYWQGLSPETAKTLVNKFVSDGVVLEIFEDYLKGADVELALALDAMYRVDSAIISRVIKGSLTQLKPNHWLAFLKTGGKICVEAGKKNSDLSEALNNLLREVIGNSNAQLESHQIDKLTLDTLIKNTGGFTSKARNSITCEYFEQESDNLSDKSFELLKGYFEKNTRSLNSEAVRKRLLMWLKQNKSARINWFVNHKTWREKYKGDLNFAFAQFRRNNHAKQTLLVALRNLR